MHGQGLSPATGLTANDASSKIILLTVRGKRILHRILMMMMMMMVTMMMVVMMVVMMMVMMMMMRMRC